MGLEKNIAGQKWYVFAFDRTDNTPYTGGSQSITAILRLDGGGEDAVDDGNPSELTDGYYVFDLLQGETDADMILLIGASSTEDIQVIGVPGVIYTVAPNTNAQNIDSDGRVFVGGFLDQAITESGSGYYALAASAFFDVATPPADVTAMQAKIDAIPTTAMRGTDIGDLNDFDPSNDTVVNVTTVGSVTTKTGYSLVSTGLDAVTAWTVDIAGALSGAVGSVASAVTTDSASRTASKADVSGLATATNVTDAHSTTDGLVGAIPTVMVGTDDAALATDMATAQGDLDTLTDAIAEPTSVPAANATLVEKVSWLYTLARNKITQTETTQTLVADNESTTIGTAAVTDDGSEATRGEFKNP